MIRIYIKFIIIIFFLSNCGTVPRDTSNACLIFSENYLWFKAVKGSEKKWGVPIELQMAIIQRESDFDWLAVPEWDKLFKIIPYKRKSSSLGYSQAVNATWEQFQRETDQKYALRISFYDSVDFIGWYVNKTNEILKISKNDYFKQYIAYHEGWGNYKNYKKSKVVIPYAKEVEKMAIKYREQMNKCKSQLTTSKFIIF